MIRIVVALVVCALGSTARADDVDHKSNDTAQLITLAGTVAAIPGVIAVNKASRATEPTVPLALAVAVIGPSAGHLYAHDYIAIGELGSIVGSILIIYGLEKTKVDAPTNDPQTDADNLAKDRKSFLLLGTTLLFCGAAWDFATTEGAVERYNARHAPPVQVSPMALAGPQSTGVGLGFAGRF